MPESVVSGRIRGAFPPSTECSCGLSGFISNGAFTGIGGNIFIWDNAPEGTCNSGEQVLSTSPSSAVATVIESGGKAAAVSSSGADPASYAGTWSSSDKITSTSAREVLPAD